MDGWTVLSEEEGGTAPDDTEEDYGTFAPPATTTTTMGGCLSSLDASDIVTLDNDGSDDTLQSGYLAALDTMTVEQTPPPSFPQTDEE